MEINKDKPSKGAEQILLAQIKQEFTAPADAIEQYIDWSLNILRKIMLLSRMR